MIYEMYPMIRRGDLLATAAIFMVVAIMLRFMP
jgi:hypothetical protein